MKKESQLSLLDLMFILLVLFSLIERFGYDWFTSDLTNETFSNQKPSWALVMVLILWLHPNRDLLYLITIPVVVLWVGNQIYQSIKSKEEVKANEN